MTKSPTKPIDTTTNTRLYMKQVASRQQQQVMSSTMGNSTMNTNFERRASANIPYTKKNTATRSEVSDIFGEATTMATATGSPTFRHGHALSVNASDIQHQGSRL